ncbi:MAG: hypothetical protein ACJA1E_000602 [Paracoccaceae bacterium]|jgi:hypothetical protein
MLEVGVNYALLLRITQETEVADLLLRAWSPFRIRCVALG